MIEMVSEQIQIMAAIVLGIIGVLLVQLFSDNKSKFTDEDIDKILAGVWAKRKERKNRTRRNKH
jgi:hypothetical protein